MELQQARISKDSQNDKKSVDGKKIYIKSTTWKKISHSLFDYQICDKNITKNSISIPIADLTNSSNILIYRHQINHQVKFLCIDRNSTKGMGCYWINQEHQKQEKQFLSNVHIPQNVEFLGAFFLKYFSPNIYKIKFHPKSSLQQNFLGKFLDKNGTDASSSGTDSINQNISLIVRSFKDKNLQQSGYPLRTGQILKLGRVSYQVKAISEPSEDPNLWDKQKKFHNNTMIIDQNIEYNQSQHLCKICLSYSPFGERDNYFFCTPCKCSGSLGLIHYQCLKGWWEHKILKSHCNYHDYLSWGPKSFQCQLCKSNIAESYMYKGQIYEISDIKIDFQRPYLYLKSQNSGRSLNLLIKNPKDKSLLLGRGNTNHIRIADPSISRSHAKIIFKQNDFYIYDLKSKFGTIVWDPEDEINLSASKKGIQIGRTVITFCMNGVEQKEREIKSEEYAGEIQ